MTESEDPGFKIKIGVGEIAAAEGLGNARKAMPFSLIRTCRG